jgi:hypothetical protein
MNSIATPATQTISSTQSIRDCHNVRHVSISVKISDMLPAETGTAGSSTKIVAKDRAKDNGSF